MKRSVILISALILSLLVLSSCSPSGSSAMAAEAEVQTTAPSDLSQGEKNGDQPDYETVFPQDQVNEITITISPEDWQLMMDDMRDLFGEQGSG